jgi:hypothetical protein
MQWFVGSLESACPLIESFPWFPRLALPWVLRLCRRKLWVGLPVDSKLFVESGWFTAYLTGISGRHWEGWGECGRNGVGFGGVRSTCRSFFTLRRLESCERAEDAEGV